MTLYFDLIKLRDIIRKRISEHPQDEVMYRTILDRINDCISNLEQGKEIKQDWKKFIQLLVD